MENGDKWPSAKQTRPLAFVRGGDLTKYALLSRDGDQVTLAARPPTEAEIDGGCDGCWRQHAPHNMGCSMTTGTPRGLKPGVMYAVPHDGVPTRMSLLTCDTSSRSVIAVEVWRLCPRFDDVQSGTRQPQHTPRSGQTAR